MEYPCHESTEENPPDEDARTEWSLLLLRPAYVGQSPRSSRSGDLSIGRTAKNPPMHRRVSHRSFRGWDECGREHRCRLLVLQQFAPSTKVPPVSRSVSHACATAHGGRPVAGGASRGQCPRSGIALTDTGAPPDRSGGAAGGSLLLSLQYDSSRPDPRPSRRGQLGRASSSGPPKSRRARYATYADVGISRITPMSRLCRCRTASHCFWWGPL